MLTITKKCPLLFGKIALAGGIALLTGSCAHQTAGSSDEFSGIQSTPDPAHFRNFYMPGEIDVRGLSTSAALEKLRVSYVGICKQNGEKPHDLAFNVPTGHEKPLRIKLSGGSLDSSVHRIAAVSKLQVIRDGTTYRFKQPKETGTLVKRTLSVPPDFAYRFGENGDAKLATAIRQDPRIGFQRAGIDLDESTKLSFSNSSILTMETRSAADEIAITTALSQWGAPVQQTLVTRVFEIAPSSDWKGPREGSFDAKTANRMLSDLAARKDVTTSEMPTVTSRSGETATLHADGKVLRIKTSLLGAGHELQSDLIGSSNGKRVELRDTGYASDMGTRFAVKTRADGSRVVFAVTPTLIDATGRPVYRSGE